MMLVHLDLMSMWEQTSSLSYYTQSEAPVCYELGLWQSDSKIKLLSCTCCVAECSAVCHAVMPADRLTVCLEKRAALLSALP